jgi:hypothetical protein
MVANLLSGPGGRRSTAQSAEIALWAVNLQGSSRESGRKLLFLPISGPKACFLLIRGGKGMIFTCPWDLSRGKKQTKTKRLQFQSVLAFWYTSFHEAYSLTTPGNIKNNSIQTKQFKNLTDK